MGRKLGLITFVALVMLNLMLASSIGGKPAQKKPAIKPQSPHVKDQIFGMVAFKKIESNSIWVMDIKARSARPWVKEGVQAFSVSRSGRLAFDRFAPFVNSEHDLNIYYSPSPLSVVIKITEDGHSISPVISPDGKRIIYQKLDWDGSEERKGRGRGLWLYDVEKKTHQLLAGEQKIPDEAKYGYKSPGPRADQWVFDKDVLWSGDGKKVVFTRFNVGGAVSYWIDFDESPPKVAFIEHSKSCGLLSVGSSEALCWNYPGESLDAIELRSGVRRTLVRGLPVVGAQFSPDSRTVAYWVGEGDKCSVWLKGMPDGKQRRLTKAVFELPDNLPIFNFNADGSKILVEKYTAWIVDTKTGSIVDLGGPMYYAVWLDASF